MTIEYTIQASDPAAHLYTVTVQVNQPDPMGQIFSLPTWIPGSYMIRDFARNLSAITAFDGDSPVQLQQLDKTRWQAPAGVSALRLEYNVYAWDLSVRTAHLDDTHGFFNGTSVFLAVEGQTASACKVTLHKPAPAGLSDWQVATSLAQTSVDANGFGDYLAQDYDDLIDHPVEMGTFERVVFHACGVPHELVLTGKYITDTARICRDLTIICEEHIRFFGEPAPMERYVFLVMVVGDGYGGLEHRASTSLLVTREHLPVPGDTSITDDYLEFLGLCSHEYFHTWNVKRIKPARFVPYELAEESHTDLLWAFEGITSYYDDLALLHCGLIDRERYLSLLGKTITRVYRGAGRLKQSVAQSSFDAWSKFYKQDENAPNAIVSYYAKGALVALSLDLLLRKKTGGRQSLQTLMQRLWQDYLATGAGIAEDRFEQLATELCGEDTSEFFQLAVYGTEDLPLQESLAEVGVELIWRAADGQDDRGGEPGKKSRPPMALGARTAPAAGGLKVTHVFDGGPARAAGWSAGDTLVALDWLAVSAGSLEKTLARHSAGDSVAAHLFRRDELLELPIDLKPAKLDTCVLSLSTEGDAVDHWLPRNPAS